LAAEKSAGPLTREFFKSSPETPNSTKKGSLAKATELRPIAPQMTTTSECRYQWLRRGAMAGVGDLSKGRRRMLVHHPKPTSGDSHSNS
jgi:hypothetical protein